ncbi:MAG: DNA polymerase III subunit beta [Tidjanibacter sp.]|nr:DNA polymerase III subunit beta [Tidjanibacter sp.]
MKFTISSSALLATLSTTGKVVSNKNTLPILDYFLFDLKDGILKVTASDLETTLISTVAVDNVEREGTIAAPVKLMLDSLKEFSEQPLTIEADENTWEITVSWKSGSLKIPGTSGLGYPALPELADDKSEVDMDVDMMIGGINKTIFAPAEDHLRPIMNGIYVNIAEGEVTFVATDAHKLVKYNAQAEVPAASSFILPKKPSSLLRSILLKEENAVKVAFDKKNVVFNLSGSTLVCRLIEGVYPNYNAVIPAANPNKVIVDRAELLNAIKRVAVCSNQATNLVEFNIAANSINLATKDLDFSYSAQETVMCAYEGSPITIGFKSTFLVDILSNIETPSVVIELADSTRAGVFKPLYDEPQSATTLMLLMPMMINA